MGRMHDDNEDMEQKLRAYLRSEAEGVEPPANLWQRVGPRLGEQRRPWLSRLTSFRPSPALAGAVVLVLLVGWAFFMADSLGQGAPVPEEPAAPAPADPMGDSPDMPGNPGNLGRPGLQGPMGPPGEPGLPGIGGDGTELRGPRLLELGDEDSNSSDGLDSRLIVYRSSLSLAVGEIGQLMDEVAQTAQDLGGFVVSSSRQGEEGASVTIRVPSESFEAAMGTLRALGTRVLSESIQSEDVTEEYVDLQSRLRNWEAAESQYLELFSKAQTVEDTLKVQRELFNVRQEIERIRGRIQYLERSSSMALITVHLSPETNPEPLVQPGWSVSETGRSATRSLADFGQGIADAAIWAGVYSPVWLIVGFVAFLAFRRLARR